MSKSNNIKWLLEQIPELVNKEIINLETADKLSGYYKNQPEDKGLSLVFIITGVLGAVLIGIGIISIFAANWSSFSKLTRTILSFLPLIAAQIIYGYAFFKKEGSIAWIESTSAFLMLMLASTLALISQTYHVSGTAEEFTITWMVLSLPLMYLNNASLPAIFYLTGISTWAVMTGFDANGNVVFYWLLLLAAIPHLLFNLDREKTTTRGVLLGWVIVLSFSVAFLGVIEPEIPEHLLMGIAIFASFFYLSGKFLFKTGKSIWTRPFQTGALFVVMCTLLVLAYKIEFESEGWDIVVSGRDYPSWAGITNFVVLILVFLSGLGLVIFRYYRKLYTNFFPGLFLVFALLILLFLDGGNTFFPTALSNLFLLLWGIYYIERGLKQQALALVNAGMLFISLLIAMRFFDPEISFVVKGIVFIILGSAFLVINYYLSRKLKKDD